MTDYFICSADTSNGDVFKNFTKINGSKSRATLIFLDKEIFMENATDDTQVCCKGRLIGESINLKWNTQIPKETRILPLMIEQSKIAATFGKIQTKDTVRIQVYKSATSENEMEYMISLTRGTSNSTDGREGMQLIPALAYNYTPNIINAPTDKSLSFAIPFREFKRMTSTFTKQKKGTLTIRFYSMLSPEFGKIGSGLSISNSVPPDGRCDGFEKFGDISQSEDFAAPSPNTGHVSSAVTTIGATNTTSSTISSMATTGSLTVAAPAAPASSPIYPTEDKSNSNSSNSSSSTSTVTKNLKIPTEYVFDANKIDLLQKFASVYKDGNVIVNYEYGKHLCISGNIGAFGVVKLYFHNTFVGANSPSKLMIGSR